MNKRIWIASLALAAAIGGFTACSSDSDPMPVPRVILSAGRSSSTTVTFTLTALHAQQAVYTVVKSGEAVPGAADILSGGVQANATQTLTYTQSGLEPGTTYVIAAVAYASGLSSAVVTVQMDTSADQAGPAVALAAGTATENSLTFTLTPGHAEKAAYMCLMWSEPLPTPETVLENGIEADAAKEDRYTVKDLDRQTNYRIVAAASAAGEVSALADIGMQTAEGRLWAVGDLYDANGIKGLVFAVFEEGRYGLILSLEEASEKYPYSSLMEYNGTGFDDSATNMALVKQFPTWETDYPAFKYCDGLNENGERTGWLLPSYEDMVALYTVYNGGATEPVNRQANDAFNKLLTDNGGVPLSPDYYWTSTEYPTRQQYFNALSFTFDHYFPYCATGKDRECRVRAIRRF